MQALISAISLAGGHERLTSRNTALAHCIGEVETDVCRMKSARSTVFGVIS
jgi:hypothetical protein